MSNTNDVKKTNNIHTMEDIIDDDMLPKIKAEVSSEMEREIKPIYNDIEILTKIMINDEEIIKSMYNTIKILENKLTERSIILERYLAYEFFYIIKLAKYRVDHEIQEIIDIHEKVYKAIHSHDNEQITYKNKDGTPMLSITKKEIAIIYDIINILENKLIKKSISTKQIKSIYNILKILENKLIRRTRSIPKIHKRIYELSNGCRECVTIIKQKGYCEVATS